MKQAPHKLFPNFKIINDIFSKKTSKSGNASRRVSALDAGVTRAMYKIRNQNHTNISVVILRLSWRLSNDVSSSSHVKCIWYTSCGNTNAPRTDAIGLELRGRKFLPGRESLVFSTCSLRVSKVVCSPSFSLVANQIVMVLPRISTANFSKRPVSNVRYSARGSMNIRWRKESRGASKMASSARLALLGRPLMKSQR